jgi:hypothetical protein
VVDLVSWPATLSEPRWPVSNAAMDLVLAYCVSEFFRLVSRFGLHNQDAFNHPETFAVLNFSRSREIPFAAFWHCECNRAIRAVEEGKSIFGGHYAF